MSLREELPPKNQPITFCNVNNGAHDEISMQVALFLRKGGIVKEIPFGVGKDTPTGFNKAAEGKKQAIIHEQFAKNPKPVQVAVKKEICEAENKAIRVQKGKPIMRPENRAKSGLMNIHTTPNGKHVVTIKSVHIGTFETLKEAIKKRDIERELMGLPKADY